MLRSAFADDDVAEFAVVQHMADVVVAGQQILRPEVEFGIDLYRLWHTNLMRQDAQIRFEAQACE
jgi:hypothetical protein